MRSCRQDWQRNRSSTTLWASTAKSFCAAPTGEGFDLVAWTLPVVALLAGLMVLYRVFRVWTRRQPLLASTPANPEAIPEEYRDRLEKELKDLD